VVLITLTFLPFTAPFAVFDWGTPSTDSLSSHQRQSLVADSRAEESGAELVLASNPVSRLRPVALIALKLQAPQLVTTVRALTAAALLQTADCSHARSIVLRI
jgi:hypothetical protein